MIGSGKQAVLFPLVSHVHSDHGDVQMANRKKLRADKQQWYPVSCKPAGHWKGHMRLFILALSYVYNFQNQFVCSLKRSLRELFGVVDILRIFCLYK